MFIGHFGLGLGAKKAAPAISLGLFFIAVQFLDLLWPTLLLLDVEHVQINADPSAPVPFLFTDYPYSHSLVMTLLWSIAFGLIYWLIKKNAGNAIILALCVFSHWVLDFIVHLPDLPLYPGGTEKFGLGMWRSQAVTLVVESIIFIIGIFLYVRATAPKNKKGSIILWVLVVLLFGSHIASIFSPPPSSVPAVAWGAQLIWVFVLLAFWCDRNRTTRSIHEPVIVRTQHG
jgi:hypothetical protein